MMEEELQRERQSTEMTSCWILMLGLRIPVNSRRSVVLVLG
jgi:hypothetical protein